MKQASIYQQHILHAFENQNSHLLIEAVAGAGKTTTLLQILSNNATSKYKRILLCAFNKKIQEELSERAHCIIQNSPSRIDIKTIHSVCYSLFSKKPKINTNKHIDILLAYDSESKLSYSQISLLADVYNMSLLTLQDDFDKVIAEYFSDEEIPSGYHIYLNHLKQVAPHKTNEITYTEMLYFPYIKNKKTEYDLILIDEAQDLSPLQQKIIFQNLSHDNTRYVIVGDSRQAIYAFAGADKTAFEKYRNIQNITELQLPLCYRCPQSHIELAQQYNPIIQPHKNEKGIIETLDHSFTPEENSLIICRNNAPLVKLYFQLIKRGVKCKFIGDIYKSLFALLYQIQELPDFKIENFPEFAQKFYEEKSKKMKKEENKQLLYDKIQVLITIYQNKQIKTIKDLFKTVKQFFTEQNDENNKILLMTIHKAKGLESDNVYFYQPHLVKKDENEQEKNLYYIALTRSKNKLFFIP